MQKEIKPNTWCRQSTSDIEELKRRFWIRVSVGGLDDCWPWVGSKWNTGYGKVNCGTRVVPAHRKAFEYCRGTFDESLDVLHRCDNPICCNPVHLFLGTARDNVRDAISKGRWVTVRGSKSGKSKLTEDQAKVILSDIEYARSHRKHLAEKFGVSYSCICHVIYGDTWSWIK